MAIRKKDITPSATNNGSPATNTNPAATEDKHAFTSGATSSANMPDYWLITPGAIATLACRLTLGKLKHGDVNYQKSIHRSDDGRVLVLDLGFARDRFNHSINHHYDLKRNGNSVTDSNLGAIMWFAQYASWVEEHGFSWRRILNPKYINETRLAILIETGQLLWVEIFDPATKTTSIKHKV